jgi:monoterpene epsilon-lactone hydrolase
MDGETAPNAGDIQLGSRVIPVPTSISPEAQAFLRGTPVAPKRNYPPSLDDKEAWRAHIAEMDAQRLAAVPRSLDDPDVTVEETRLGGALVQVGTPRVVAPEDQDKALLFLHGGALIYCGGEFVPYFAQGEAKTYRMKVFAVDYRMPPDHPFPAGLDDCVAVYEGLLEQYRPENIAIYGISAGGNLAAATPLKIRDRGLPLPAAVGLFTPELDLTETGDSFVLNKQVDCIASWPYPEPNALYAAGADLADPYVSPLFGDFSKGFPPTFIQAGTRDLLLSNAVRMHRALRRADVEAELNVWEAMPHAGFGGRSPEDLEMRREFRRFLDRKLGRRRS